MHWCGFGSCSAISEARIGLVVFEANSNIFLIGCRVFRHMSSAESSFLHSRDMQDNLILYVFQELDIVILYVF